MNLYTKIVHLVRHNNFETSKNPNTSMQRNLESMAVISSAKRRRDTNLT